MAVLKEGRYLGRYKDGDIYYYQFEPETIAENGETKYVRIGEREEEFANDRTYIISKINMGEEDLIIKSKK